MTFTESMFKFPYRIYEEKLSVLNEIEPINKDTKWVVGWKKIFAKDIVSIADTFYMYSDIDEIIDRGFDASLIFTKEDIYSCDWDLKTLEKRLDDHMKRINNKEHIKKRWWKP